MQALSWCTNTKAYRTRLDYNVSMITQEFIALERVGKVIPGKNGASAIPKQNRTATRPPKLVVPAVDAEMQDQTQTQKGMYNDGRTLVKIILLGICMRT
jgi:hypothetical protein